MRGHWKSNIDQTDSLYNSKVRAVDMKIKQSELWAPNTKFPAHLKFGQDWKIFKRGCQKMLNILSKKSWNVPVGGPRYRYDRQRNSVSISQARWQAGALFALTRETHFYM